MDLAFLGPAYFWLFAIVAVCCAGGLLISRHPISGAVNLIGVMLALAGLYAVLASPFVAVLQVLVYAGAIMMLLVFVIMVLNQGTDHRVPRFDALSIAGVILPALLCAGVAVVLHRTAQRTDPEAAYAGINGISALLFTAANGWWLLFEIGGLVLLAAVVGAVMLAKRSLDTTPEAPATEPAEAPAQLHGAAADHDGTAVTAPLAETHA